MALIQCKECGKQISDKASACPTCGAPMNQDNRDPLEQESGTLCKNCLIYVTPVVTSVGGGSCSVGKRETWKCPKCKRVLHQSGCFVATVTYGDEDIVEVRFLRAFRDQVLMSSVAGRIFTRLYYKCSPYVARLLELSPWLRKLSRHSLDLVVAQIELRTQLKRSSFRPPLP